LDPNRKKDDVDIFVEASMKIVNDLVYLMITNDRSAESIAGFDAALDSVWAYAEKFLAERTKRPDFGSGHTYFEKLMARKEISWEEILSTMTNFLFAGVDTTNGLTLWMLFNLSRFPEVQEKLYQEIVTVAGDGPVTAQHLEKMDYLKYVMRESFRSSPPFSPNLIFRILDHPIVLGGYEIPPGVRLAMPISTIQNDPKIVEKPEEFIPERWSKSAIAGRNGTPQEVIDSLIISKPFGYGPRMCVGSRLAEFSTEINLRIDIHQVKKLFLLSLAVQMINGIRIR